MDNSPSTTKMITYFGFGGGLIITLGGLLAGNTGMTALGLLGGGGLGATGIVLEQKNKSEQPIGGTPSAPAIAPPTTPPQPSPQEPSWELRLQETRPISIEQILTDLELKFQTKDGNYILFSGTENYVDKDGDKSLPLVISDNKKAEVLSITSPGLYMVPAHLQELFAEACITVQFKSKFLRYELDERDGEVRACIEMPYSGDQFITKKQLVRAIIALVGLVDQYEPFLRSVLRDRQINYQQVFS